LPRDFVQLASRVQPEVMELPVLDAATYGSASQHYSMLWWNNSEGKLPEVPRDAIWSWGLGDVLTVVMPSLDLVVTRAGKSWKRKAGADPYAVLKPFLTPLAAAARQPASGAAGAAPYPPSPVIRGVDWAPRETIIHLAKGSDNWPMTWADDDGLYTAYGDGWGFEPLRKTKISLGLARITGNPPVIQGVNLEAPDAEALGDGRKGRKASGLLMVDGVLYLWARNLGNAQLAWSENHGASWTWADWKFTQSFGCPTFLNFGRNYSGAPDDYVYVYSHDADSAYDRADRMVLARVHKSRVRERGAYEFFVKLGDHGAPVWTPDLAQRGAVFQNAGNCYRSNVSYNPALKRYLWCQTGQGADLRHEGGLAIYDAPQPWGPWTTVFHTKAWDVGPGDSSVIPTKWISGDGRTFHLVYAGEDSFSLRRGTFK
jgi:hypothetical protein